MYPGYIRSFAENYTPERFRIGEDELLVNSCVGETNLYQAIYYRFPDGIARKTIQFSLFVPGWATYVWGLQFNAQISADGSNWAAAGTPAWSYSGSTAPQTIPGPALMILIPVIQTASNFPAPFSLYVTGYGS